MDYLPLLIPVLTAFIISVPTLLKLRRDVKVRVDQIDAASRYEALWSKELERNRQLLIVIDLKDARIDKLEAQLVSAGMEPVAE
jgi:hypothetical protein